MTTTAKTITQTVQIGQDGYGVYFKLLAPGSIYPATAGADGLVAGMATVGVHIANDSVITGGLAPSGTGTQDHTGGAGVLIQDAAECINTGTISGGYTDQPGTAVPSQENRIGGVGAILGAGCHFDNVGVIEGGSSYDAGGAGSGVLLSGATLTNSGHIVGGGALGAGYGGLGVAVSQSGSLINRGVITGGSGGGFTAGGQASAAGAAPGLVVEDAGVVTNTGTVIGGNASYLSGASGAVVDAGGVLTNRGTITAGFGGDDQPTSGVSLAGTVLNSGLIESRGLGAGAYISAGILINTGTIAGYGSQVELRGSESSGIGVDITGGTLVNAGTISVLSPTSGGSGDAVVLDPAAQAATLVVQAGAVFDGQVQAIGQGVSILELGGAKPGVLSGLGGAFTGFTVIEVDGAGGWTLSGSNTLAATTVFVDAGKAFLNGILQDAGSLRINDAFTVKGTGAAQVQALSLQQGTLSVTQDAQFAVSAGTGPDTRGELYVGASGKVTGSGTLEAARGIIDDGTISASSTLVLEGALSGSGLLAIGPEATVTLSGKLAVANISFSGSDDLRLYSAQADATLFSGFTAGDTITLLNQNVDDIIYENSILRVLNGTTTVDAFRFSGDYVAAGFNLSTTDDEITYSAPAATREEASRLLPIGAATDAREDVATHLQRAQQGCTEAFPFLR